MSFFLTVSVLFLQLILPSLLHTSSNEQPSIADIEAKNDIAIISLKLESFYAKNSTYPTAKDLTRNYDIILPSLDVEVLYDSKNRYINAGGYEYIPDGCTSLDCRHFVLRTALENGQLYEVHSKH